MLAEVAACVRNKRPYIHGVSQLLIKQTLTCDVDDTKPVEFLFVSACAEIHCQLVVEEMLFFFISEIVEI